MRSKKEGVCPTQYLRLYRRITGSGGNQPANVPVEWVKSEQLVKGQLQKQLALPFLFIIHFKILFMKKPDNNQISFFGTVIFSK